MEQNRTTGGGTTSGNGDKGRPKETGVDLERQIEQQFHEVRERLSEMSDRLAGFIRERPGTSLLIAAGLGYLVGRILRS